jgi:uncharacterized protein DUF3558
MGSIRSAAVVLTAASVVFVGACSSAEPGTPSAGDDPTTATRTTGDESSEEPTSTESSVDRPKAIDMASIDICQVLAAVPPAPFGLDGRAPLPDESSSFPGAKSCFTSGISANLGLLLTAVTDEGVDDYVESVTAEPAETTVKGYRVVVLTPTSNAEDCFGVIDVDDGQLLHINYGPNSPGEPPVTPQATVCERIPQIAEAALTALGV